MFGGWFCQPLPTGATPDGTNYGACEKVRSEVECATAGGDGACRCTWAPHKLGIQYKRPGGKICAPRAGWKASDDTCVPPAVGAPLTTPPSANEDGGEDPGKTPVPPVPSDPATLRCFMHHEVNCPLDRCSWVANSCCAATDSWCQNTGATTSGCTHYQDEASCPTDSNGGAADRCYWGGTFCQSRGATGYGDPKTACESYPLQQQCPAGRCAWSQTNEACEPSSSYGLADLRVAGESAALAYKSGYTPQDMRDAGFKLGEVADALSGCIECQKAAARHAAAAEAVKDGTRNGAPAEPGDVHDDRGNSESESEHRGEDRPSSYFTGSKPKAGSKSTSTSAAAAGRVLSTNHTTSSKPSLNAWQRKQLQRTVGLAATEHATTATWTTVLPYSAPARESLTVAEAIAKGFTAAEERTAGCPLKDMAEGLRVLRKDGLAATEAATVGFNKIEMRAGGYSPEEIGEVLAGARLQDGITVKQAHDLGYTPDEIRAAGFSDPEIAETAAEVREGGTSARASYDLGFRPSELREAGYTQAEVMAVLSALKAEGLSSSDANERGWSLAELRQAGYNLQQIGALLSGLREDDGSGTGMTIAEAYDAGFTPAEMEPMVGGYTEAQITAELVLLTEGGMSLAQAHAAGFMPDNIYHEGYTRATIGKGLLRDLRLGGSMATMKAMHAEHKKPRLGRRALKLRQRAAGWSVAQAYEAGFSPAEIVLAGWTPEQLGAALTTMRKGGTTAHQAVLGGFSKGSLAWLATPYPRSTRPTRRSRRGGAPWCRRVSAATSQWRSSRSTVTRPRRSMARSPGSRRAA